MPERQINLSTFRGEQDAENKVSYTEWARDAKDNIKAKGKAGRVLVSMMQFAERLGNTPITEETRMKLGVGEDAVNSSSTPSTCS